LAKAKKNKKGEKKEDEEGSVVLSKEERASGCKRVYKFTAMNRGGEKIMS